MPDFRSFFNIHPHMLQVIFESSTEHPSQRDRPKALHFQVSRASVTNVRSMERSSRADLAKCIDTYQLGSLFFGADFPALPDDYHVVTDKFLNHVAGKVLVLLFFK
jgi:hypothetical protein